MPQYTNTSTSGLGFTVTTVLDTETNLQTITVTAPTGQTATATQPASFTRPTSATVNSLTSQLEAAGARNVNLTDIGGAARVSNTNVVQQAARADVAATATNSTVPQNPNPPAPVVPASNANAVPPVEDPPVSNATAVAVTGGAVTNTLGNATPTVSQPQTTTPLTSSTANAEQPPVSQPANVDTEFGNLDEAIVRQQGTTTVLSEDGTPATGVLRNTETGDVIYTDPPKGDDQPFDEFAGVDEAVQQQKIINENTSGIPIRAEDGTVAQGVAINPETGETYYTTAAQGLAATKNARQQATKQDQANFELKKDWRVRLSLTPGAKYLYKAPKPGILAPLAATDGVLFPYTPSIQVNYAAHYDATDLVHTNYKVYQYKNSGIDQVTITCDFTAQDTYEANYLLAVIHFFRSVTKMFYGQDDGPAPGTPPPLCYLYGLGAFQFEAHPLAITTFNYSLPTEVDYIRATTNETTLAGVNKSASNVPNNTYNPSSARMAGSGVGFGGLTEPPDFSEQTGGTVTPTYVPTKMQITINAVPIISRNNISTYFSLKEYATGKLMRGTQTKRGGIW